MTEGNTLTDLLTLYLYDNKYLSLPKLGRFDVSDEVDLSEPERVEFNRIPKEAIRFTANAQEETDTKLVRYITDHTRKMQSLAVADLFTLTDQASQMLNIFQPVSFAGIGTLNKNAKGEIHFTPGAYRSELHKKYSGGTYLPDFSEKPSTPGIKTDTPASASSGLPASRSGGGLIIIICLIIAGVLIYFMFSQGEENVDRRDVTVVEGVSGEKDGDEAVKEDTQRAATPAQYSGILHYEVVFEHNVDSARAFHRYNQLTGWGHKVIMRTADSVHFTLAIPFTSPASDTAHAKDSIRILYGKPTTIRYNTGE